MAIEPVRAMATPNEFDFSTVVLIEVFAWVLVLTSSDPLAGKQIRKDKLIRTRTDTETHVELHTHTPTHTHTRTHTHSHPLTHTLAYTLIPQPTHSLTLHNPPTAPHRDKYTCIHTVFTITFEFAINSNSPSKVYVNA